MAVIEMPATGSLTPEWPSCSLTYDQHDEQGRLRYDGEASGGVPHGFGVQRGHHMRYGGQWVEGLKDGKGVVDYDNGARYAGDWQASIAPLLFRSSHCVHKPQANRWHGAGVFTGPDGSSYSGQWVSHRRHGFGSTRQGPDLPSVATQWVSGVEKAAELDEAAMQSALAAQAQAEEASESAEALARKYAAYGTKAEAQQLQAALDGGEPEAAQRELALVLLAAHTAHTKKAKERRREAEVHLLSAEGRAVASHEAAAEAALEVAAAVRELTAAQERYEAAQAAQSVALGPVAEARLARDRVRCEHTLQGEDEAAARALVSSLVAEEGSAAAGETQEGGEPVVPQGKAEMKVAIDAFNKDPRKGLKLCIDKGILGDRPLDVVSFIQRAHGLSATNVGEYFGRIIRDEFILEVFQLYVEGFDFAGITLDTALRLFLEKFRLPGEAQIIDRIMEAFATHFCRQNPEAFNHPDTAFILSFSIIMLNTDIHNPSIKPERKMTAEAFVRNNRGIDGGGDLPAAMLEEIYNNIKEEEIKMNADAQKYGEVRTFLAPEMEGWLSKQDTNSWNQGWQRRWFVVTDHCLYYFVKPEDPQMRSIIPLETGVVVNVLSEVDFSFAISREDGGQLKSAKLHADGHMNIENRTEYVLQAGSAEELDRWVNALREEVAVQGTAEDDKRQKRKKVVKAINERSKHHGAAQ